MSASRRVVAIVLKDGEGNTIGTKENPVIIAEPSEIETSGTAPHPTAEYVTAHLVGDDGCILGTLANPLIFAMAPKPASEQIEVENKADE